MARIYRTIMVIVLVLVCVLIRNNGGLDVTSFEPSPASIASTSLRPIKSLPPPFKLRNTAQCAAFLDDSREAGGIHLLSELMLEVLEDGEEKIRARVVPTSSVSGSGGKVKQADELLRLMMEACHGPNVPPALLEKVTARNWVADLFVCSHHPFGVLEGTPQAHKEFRSGHPKFFGGEFCSSPWRSWLDNFRPPLSRPAAWDLAPPSSSG
eukprot:CAMPEP_0171935534 /NCGR_PEP_ID=MMETSP0993-20121228/33009_1 /TAXON_ID=483369 /ORGANISM="non described non described, Strain CCMP2098" /LENGTH=209 /DNA_ID=CAMNT_0012576479 /DNA_START=92 /DNA_END=718 /DNA_ORIENTATION=-